MRLELREPTVGACHAIGPVVGVGVGWEEHSQTPAPPLRTQRPRPSCPRPRSEVCVVCRHSSRGVGVPDPQALMRGAGDMMLLGFCWMFSLYKAEGKSQPFTFHNLGNGGPEGMGDLSKITQRPADP